MNKLKFLLGLLCPWKGPRRAPGRGDRTSRRSRHLFEHESHLQLETRQLLANFSVTYSASVPSQPTDYTAPLSLPKFSPALGTLTEVDLSFAASGTQGGTLTNVAASPQDFSFAEDVNLALQDATSTLLAPDLVASQSYTALAPNASAPFGPFTPSQSSAAVYTSGPTFDEFAAGPGNINLSVTTFTNQTITGGGGNVRAKINTNAGGVATVVYRYSATPVTLAGNVYEDVKGTGALAAGDKPIPGTTLTLLDANGAVVATTTTAADGTYSFTATTGGGPLPPGTYSVAETQPAGYLQGSNTVGIVNGTTDGSLTATDVIGSIALTSGQASVGNNFGEVLPVRLSGIVYEDVNGVGSLTPGDRPIPGTTLTLLDSTGMALATTTTAADGTYSFTATTGGGPLPPGTYSVAETQPAGYLQGSNTVGTVNGVTDGTLPSLDVIGSIALTSNQSSIGNNFGEVLPVTLSGNVYEDVKGTGTLVPGDLPIPGTLVTLSRTVGGIKSVVATTTTAAEGIYSFTATSSGAPLPPGNYSLTETQPAGFLQGTNTAGTVNGVTVGSPVPVDNILSIGLTSGQASIGNNFGEVRPVTISGNVYDDLLKAGRLQPGDPPIPGVVIRLFNPGSQVAMTTTDASGAYSFTTSSAGAPLPPDTYTIVESQPAGYLQGTNTVGTVNGLTVGNLPATDLIGSVALTSGQASVGNNFGELLPPPPPFVTNVNITNVQRFGVHLQPTLIVLTFDGPLDPATAQNPANYQIFGPTGSGHPAQIPVDSATYNPATDMVTLRLGERLNVHETYRLTVNGVRSASGGLLVGSNGQAGGSFVTTIQRSNLSGFTDIYGNFIPVNHGKLYPAAIASGYQLKRFVQPANLGAFAPANRSSFLAATASAPEPAPISYFLARKAARYHRG